MLGDISQARNIYIACGSTDMRKAIDGLAAIVQKQFRLDPFSRDLFLFCGKRHDRIKILLWEGDGFVLLYKRLEDGRFNWPRQQSEVKQLTRQQLNWLLEGLSIEQPKAIKQIKNPGNFY
jgi:transposase